MYELLFFIHLSRGVIFYSRGFKFVFMSVFYSNLSFKIPLADEIVGTLGEGAFGKVVECIDHSFK